MKLVMTTDIAVVGSTSSQDCRHIAVVGVPPVKAKNSTGVQDKGVLDDNVAMPRAGRAFRTSCCDRLRGTSDRTHSSTIASETRLVEDGLQGKTSRVLWVVGGNAGKNKAKYRRISVGCSVQLNVR